VSGKISGINFVHEYSNILNKFLNLCTRDDKCVSDARRTVHELSIRDKKKTSKRAAHLSLQVWIGHSSKWTSSLAAWGCSNESVFDQIQILGEFINELHIMLGVMGKVG